MQLKKTNINKRRNKSMLLLFSFVVFSKKGMNYWSTLRRSFHEFWSCLNYK